MMLSQDPAFAGSTPRAANKICAIVRGDPDDKTDGNASGSDMDGLRHDKNNKGDSTAACERFCRKYRYA